MTLEEIAIYHMLKNNPGMMYVTPDSRHIYVMAVGSMICITSGEDLSILDEVALNQILQDFLKDAC